MIALLLALAAPGDELPRTIRALHAALAARPADGDLHRALAAARARVPYPPGVMRPISPGGLRHRVGPWGWFAAAALAVGLLSVGLAARFTTAPRWATPAAFVGAVLGIFTIVAAAVAAVPADPVAVIAVPTVARTGNGDAFPPRVESPLPPGVEVNVVGDRGGWLHVALPGGALAWVPAAAVLR